MWRFLSLFLIGIGAAAHGEIGRLATPQEISAWDIDVRPDGFGLPQGRGNVAMGAQVYEEKCAVCHGDFGEGIGRYPALAGGFGTLQDARPVKTIGSYWPYLSTVWDYVHHAMPYGAAQTLGDDETYGVVAYLLYLNDLVEDEEFVLSHENLALIRLPNEAGFYDDDRGTVEVPQVEKHICMVDCKKVVAITRRATGADVTPK